MCQQYVVKGSCRRAQGKCKFWHICRSFIEGNFDGKCRLSHDFFDTDNREKIKRLALEKHSNGTVRDIVAWSLPQVCQLYLKSECKTEKCPYIHVCSKTVRGSSCKCTLSHNLTDSHNKNILKQYDLAPHQRMSVDFVRCSVLVPNKQKHFRKSNYSLIDDDTAVGKEVNASNTIPTVTAPPPSQGTVNVLCNTPAPVAASSNISSSSKHSQAKFVSHTQPAAEKKAGSLKKQKRGLKRSKTLTQQLEITTAVHPVVNNLANNSCSTSSKDSLECLNIPAEEKENLSDLSSDENNIANVCQNTLKKTENRKKTNSRTAEPTKGKETNQVPARNTATPMYSVPSHWSPMSPSKKYKRVPLEAFSSEFKEVEQFFKSRMETNVVINSIERVQNPFVWESYQRKKANMLAVNADGDRRNVVNEQKLFHAGSSETLKEICEQNFEKEKYLTIYGKGNYFALSASKIYGLDHKCSKKDAKLIFLAKVLVGSYTKGSSSYLRPPQKDSLNSYDSCVDDESNPTIFVVFNTDQVYPEYIINYSDLEEHHDQTAPYGSIADNSSQGNSITRDSDSNAPFSQTKFHQTPPLRPRVFQAPHLQIRELREQLTQAHVFEAPLLQSQLSQGLLSQDQVYQALLSQARVSQTILSQAQLFQSMLLQAGVFQGPLSQPSQVSKQLSQDPFSHAHSQVSQAQLPDHTTGAMPSISSMTITKPCVSPCVAPLAQTQVSPALVSQTKLSPVPLSNPEGSQAQISQALVYSALQSQAKVPQASPPQIDVSPASASQSVVSQVPPSQTQLSQTPLSQAKVCPGPSSQAQVSPVSVLQTSVSQLSLSQAQALSTPLSQSKVQQAPLIQTQVSPTLVPQTEASHIPLSQTQVSLTPLSQVQVSPALDLQAHVSDAQASQARSQVKVSLAQVSSAVLSKAQACQVPLLQAEVFQAPLSEAQVCFATLSRAQQVSQGSLLQTQGPYAPLSKIQASQASFTQTSQILRAPILETRVSQTPLSQAQFSQTPLPQTVVSYASMSPSQVPQPRVSRALFSQSAVTKGPVSQSHVSQAQPLQTVVSQASFSQGKVSHSPLLSTRVYEVPHLQSRLSKMPPSQSPTYQAPVSQGLTSQSPSLSTRVLQVPLSQSGLSQSPSKARVTQEQFSYDQLSQSPFLPAHMSQTGNVCQPSDSQVQLSKTTGLQPRISHAHTIRTTVPQLHPSKSSIYSCKPAYSVRCSASVNSTTDGVSWNTPRDKSFAFSGPLTHSSYHSRDLPSYAPPSSESYSWTAPRSTSLTEYTNASNAHVRRNFFAAKTSSEKMKIMSAIIVIFIISTIIITLYIE
ncbi:hypothetical protein ACROYT_G002352 [Oculina patagonica]